MTTPPPGWYPSPDAAGMHRWWDGLQWTAHVRPTVSDAPAPAPHRTPEPAGALPAEYAAAFEATAALQQRGGFAGAIGGLGQQFLSTALAQAAPAQHPGGHRRPAAARRGRLRRNAPAVRVGAAQPYGPAGTAAVQPCGHPAVQPCGHSAVRPGRCPALRLRRHAALRRRGTDVRHPAQVQGAAEVFGGIVGDRRGGGVGNGLKLILIGLVFALTSVFVVPQIMSAHAGAGETTTSGTVVALHESTGNKGSRMCSPEATFAVGGATYSVQANYSSSELPVDRLVDHGHLPDGEPERRPHPDLRRVPAAARHLPGGRGRAARLRDPRARRRLVVDRVGPATAALVTAPRDGA